MTYTELKTKVENHFNRGDIASKIEGWIQTAESFLFREIQPNTLEDTATGTTTGTIALPADFSRLIRLDLDYSGQVATLDYTTQGQGFVIEANTIRLTNPVDTTYTYTLYYSPKLTALSATNATNWLLDNGLDLYFYAAVMEGARALKNDGEMARVQAIIPSILDSVKSYAVRAKIPTAGGLRIRPRSTV